MNRGQVQAWLADSSAAPSRDSEGIREAWRNGDYETRVERRPVSFEIEEGVEVPPQGSRATKYPWHKMEPGQSFFVRDEDAPDSNSAIAGTGREWCKRHRPDCTVIQRTVEGGLRVWMVPVEDDEES